MDGAFLHACNAGAVNVVLEVGMLGEVDHELTSLDAQVGGEVDTCSGINALRTVQSATNAEEEGSGIPGVIHGEGDNALLQHGVQVLDVFFSEDVLVVPHEPGVGSHGETVNAAVGVGDGVDVGLSNVVLDLLQVGTTQLSQSAGLNQSTHLVVSVQENVSSSSGVVLDDTGSVAFTADTDVPGDGVFGMSFLELGQHDVQPAVLVNLVSLGSPNLQGDSSGACIFCGSSSLGSLGLSGSFRAAAGNQTESHCQHQQHCNDLLHCVFSSYVE